jgi:hypothetical protein
MSSSRYTAGKQRFPQTFGELTATATAFATVRDGWYSAQNGSIRDSVAPSPRAMAYPHPQGLVRMFIPWLGQVT